MTEAERKLEIQKHLELAKHVSEFDGYKYGTNPRARRFVMVLLTDIQTLLHGDDIDHDDHSVWTREAPSKADLEALWTETRFQLRGAPGYR